MGRKRVSHVTMGRKHVSHRYVWKRHADSVTDDTFRTCITLLVRKGTTDGHQYIKLNKQKKVVAEDIVDKLFYV